MAPFPLWDFVVFIVDGPLGWGMTSVLIARILDWFVDEAERPPLSLF
jgi:hypothetical protein